MKNLNRYIDHTLLKQGCTKEEIKQLCQEAVKYNFYSVCIPPSYVKYCADYLEGSYIKVCTVIGFPFAYSDINTTSNEVYFALANGANEIDIVQNVSLVKNREWEELKNDIEFLLEEVKFEDNITTKIILETGLLTDEEIIKCCEIYSSLLSEGDFIKTSTGFAKEISDITEFQKQKLNAVSIIKANIPEHLNIKASGGIRDIKFASKLIEAGATRLGCSSGVELIENITISEGGY